jgi:DNA-binding transcriptional MerR regulator/methylmalonyl-CoA mutase cobalamin-binding subunit
MYTIKHAAELTGLSATTMRAWERRYGVVSPHRTETGYRVYDADAVRTLCVMASLVDQGWAPRQAADEVRRLIEAGEAHIAQVARVRPAVPSESQARVEELVEAAVALDAVAVSRVLDERFSLASFESVIDGWLMPSLVDLGRAWADGRVSVAGEHLVAYAVQRRLAAVFDAASARAAGPRVLVGLPPGARHELGLLAFAAAACRAGLNATYVGADLPSEDWVTATKSHYAVCVVLAAHREDDLDGLRNVIDSLRVERPGLLIGVGGAQQDASPDVCLRLGHSIGDAAARLASMLTHP